MARRLSQFSAWQAAANGVVYARRTVLAIAAVLSFVAMPIAYAEGERLTEEEATQFIMDLAARAASTLGPSEQDLVKREEALRNLLRGGFEIPFIAQLSLGKHWRRVAKDEKAAYTELFGEFLLMTYGSKLATFDKDKFEVVGAVPRGQKDMVVQTKILQPSGPPIKAGWRVRKFDGEPRIIDILVEGVSMVLNQRQEFSAVLSKDGVRGLMAMLRARTQRLPVEGPTGDSQKS